MANEIVKNTESYILVQVSENGEESVLSNDYRGQFYPGGSLSIATKFDNVDKAKSLAERLNSLNKLNFEFGIVTEKVTIKPVKMTTTLEYLDKNEKQTQE